MKVIDLLNKIANGTEVPRFIKVFDEIYEYEEYNKLYRNSNNKELFNIYNGNILSYDAEIIEYTPKENKKIEKFYFSVYQDQKLGGREVVEPLETKINEIINKINENVKK